MHSRKLMSLLLSASIVVGMGSNLVFADVVDTEDLTDEVISEEEPAETSSEEEDIIEVEDSEEVFDVAPEDDVTEPSESQEEFAVDVEEGESYVFEAMDISIDDIEITANLFPDDNFRAYVSSAAVDSDGNGFLSSNEIAAVTSMDISSKSIIDISGIEIFTDLEILDCHDNLIGALGDSLDVSGNSNLRELYCYSNYFDTLDLSNNSVLSTAVDSVIPVSVEEEEATYLEIKKDDVVLIVDGFTRLDTPNTAVISVEHYGSSGSDTEDDAYYFEDATYQALYYNKNIVIIIPDGTYYLGHRIPVFSNTSIYASDNATMIATFTSSPSMLYGAHSHDGYSVCTGSCELGGYDQISNITMSGGVWDRGESITSIRTGIIFIRHAQNISISNLTMVNCTDHFINASGCNGVSIDNVIFKNALIIDPVPSGYNFYSREAIHTDYINNVGENSPLAEPWDNTPTINVTVTGCTFNNVMAGIGTHNKPLDNTKRASNYTITNNTFVDVRNYCLILDSFDHVNFSNNICTRCTSMVLAYRSTDVTISDNTHSSVYSGSYTDTSRCVIYCDNVTSGFISGNVINNSYQDGIQIRGNSDNVTVDGNTVNNSIRYGMIAQDSSNVVFCNNAVDGTTSNYYGMRFESLTGTNKIDGNHIVSTSQSSGCDGIYVRYTPRVVITNNVIENVGRRGINVTFSSNAYIANNTIDQAPESAIWIDAMDGDTLTGVICEDNVIEKPGKYGVVLRNAKSCTVWRNRVTSPGKGDLYFMDCTDCIGQGWQTGWYNNGTDWFYFNENSYMQFGWQKISNKWYYFNKSTGAMVTGWNKLSGKWYYFTGSGAMLSGWQKISGKWYYFNTDGSMRTGWFQSGGKWYHFASGGEMHTGWQKLGGVWYYFNGGGDMRTGWLKSGSSWYYFDSSGAMVAGRSLKIGNKTYRFNSAGVCQNP